MKSIFKATAILSGSSLISILVSLVSAKTLALYLQPIGYGYYGLLQSFVAFSSLVTGFGMATGLVRLGAGSAAGGDEAAVSALRRAAWVLFAGFGTVSMTVLAFFRHTVSRWATGNPDNSAIILVMGIGVLFTAAGAVQTGILNSYHRVGALAKSSIANTVIGAAISITAVVVWGIHGVVPAVVGGTVVTWLAATYFLHKEVGPARIRPERRNVVKAVRELLRFGGPYTASMLLGSGVQLALPMVVVHLLSTESVGYYRSAAAISVGYLGFLVTAMGQDYYPRLSATKDSGELVKLINEQHRLVMILAVPMILATLALVPIIIPLVYSHKFAPAIDILEWQLIGDIFKFTSWTMSFAILARFGSATYFLVEFVGGIVTLSSTWLAVRWMGLAGLGVSFLATYAIYYLVVWVVIRRKIPLVWTAANKRMLAIAMAAALIVRVLPATRFAQFRTPVALLLAVVIGIPSLLVIWKEFVSGRDLKSAIKLSAKVEQSAAAV